MTEEEISEWAKKLVHRYDNIKIVGAGGEWSGDTRQGFMFNPRTKAPEATTPTVPSGACCFNDGTCLIETESECNAAGGSYQGDDTSCSPTGACCMGTDCISTNEICCTNAGGTYHGDGTLCDPNPCVSGCLCSSIDVTWSATAVITDDRLGTGCVILSFTASDSTTLFPDFGCDTNTELFQCCLGCNADLCACEFSPNPPGSLSFCEAVFDFSSVGNNITTGAELAHACSDVGCPVGCPFGSDYFVNISTSHVIVSGSNTFTDTFSAPGPPSLDITLTTTVVCNP